MHVYMNTAWDDFIEHQIKPFGKLPFFIGIGNHELYGKTRDDFKRAFQPWLMQKRLHDQRNRDAAKAPKAAMDSLQEFTKSPDDENSDNGR